MVNLQRKLGAAGLLDERCSNPLILRGTLVESKPAQSVRWLATVVALIHV